jgi:hypothetical protein
MMQLRAQFIMVFNQDDSLLGQAVHAFSKTTAMPLPPR